MRISMPREPVFYYECSAGDFRLVYFLPAGHLKNLLRRRRISEQAVSDFPDGVDIGCTEADFDDFEQLYGWRPPLDPEAICRAFLAILSDTRRWKSFRGSGLIPAKDLEQRVDAVTAAVERDAPPLPATPPGRPTPTQRRRAGSRRARVRRALEKLRVRKIDPKKDLREQVFSQLTWTRGESAVRVFSRLHEKRKRRS
jgi:hypothetical protein